MSTILERMLAVTDKTDDIAISAMIAEKLIFYNTKPEYRFAINHNVRPPECKACPLDYDWAVGKSVGIETPSKARAIKWLTNAALLGYDIDTVDAKRKSTSARIESIKLVRERARRHQQPKSQHDDDDIPF